MLARRDGSRCCRALVLARIKMEAEEGGAVVLALIKMLTEDPTCAFGLPGKVMVPKVLMVSAALVVFLKACL